MFGKENRDSGRRRSDGGTETTNEEHSHNRRGRNDRSHLSSRRARSSHRGSAMIETLVPASACAEMFSDAPESTMFSIEAAAVEGAVAERRREFGTVRYCARKALLQIGEPAAPICTGTASYSAPRRRSTRRGSR